jgi:hypothetical protein
MHPNSHNLIRKKSELNFLVIEKFAITLMLHINSYET